jgi:hypothetical protein
MQRGFLSKKSRPFESGFPIQFGELHSVDERKVQPGREDHIIILRAGGRV